MGHDHWSIDAGVFGECICADDVYPIVENMEEKGHIKNYAEN